MKVIPLQVKIVSTKPHVYKSLSHNDKNLLTLFGEVWYDNNEEFSEHFTDKLFNAIRNDPHIKEEYYPSYEEKELLKQELVKQFTITGTTANKQKLKQYIETVSNSNPPKFSNSSISIIERIANTMIYDMNTLVILNHPETYAGGTLDECSNISQEHIEFYNTLKYCIGRYETVNDTDPVCELDPDKFSFKYLRSIGIAFGFETPIFTSKVNIGTHKHYWDEFMTMLYEKVLTINDETNVITVGCSEKFNDMLEDILADNDMRLTTFDNIYKYGSFNLDTTIVSKLGEHLGSILARLDKYNLRNNSKDKIMRY